MPGEKDKLRYLVAAWPRAHQHPWGALLAQLGLWARLKEPGEQVHWGILTAFQFSLLDLQLCPFARKADKKVSNHFRKVPVWRRQKVCFFSHHKLPASEVGSPDFLWRLLLQGKYSFRFMLPAHLWGARAAVAPGEEGHPSFVHNGEWFNGMRTWPHKPVLLGGLLTILGGS